MKFISASSFWLPDFMVDSAWHEHAPFAFWLMEAQRPRVLAELGTHHGFSYCCFCHAIERLGLNARAYAVDTWKGDEHAGFYNEDVFQKLSNYQERYRSFSRLIRSTFDEALTHFEDGSIDLLHIDGRHFYEDIKHDFECWRPKLSAKSVVIFHDTNVRERHFGVYQLWAEIKEHYPAFEFFHGHGLGVLGYGGDQCGELQQFFRGAQDDSAALLIRETYANLGHRVALRYGNLMLTAAAETQQQSLAQQFHVELQAHRARSLGEKEQLANALNAEIEHLKLEFAGEKQRYTEEIGTELGRLEGELNLAREEALAFRATQEAERLRERRSLEVQLENARDEIGALKEAHEVELHRMKEEVNSVHQKTLALREAQAEELSRERAAAKLRLRHAGREMRALKKAHMAELHRRESEFTAARESDLENAGKEMSALKEAHAAELCRRESELIAAREADLENARKEISAFKEAHAAKLYSRESELIAVGGAGLENARKEMSALKEAHAAELSRVSNRLEQQLTSERALREEESLKAANEYNALLSEMRGRSEEYVNKLARLKWADRDGRLLAKLHSLHRRIVGRVIPRGKWNRLARRYQAIAASPLFDEEWYLANNPDVANAKLDPVLHYLRHGGKEARAPGPLFDSEAYLQINSDVAAAGANPLLHYILYGNREARRVSPDLPLHHTVSEAAPPSQQTRGEEPQQKHAEEKASPARLGLQKVRPADAALGCYRYITTHPDMDLAVLPPLDISVSVVIPAYNAGPELRPLIEKLFRQKGMKSIEVVIVDSESRDGTAETCSNLGCKVIRIKQSEFSHSHSRNLGAENASGDILVFMVQDAYPIGDHWLYGLARCLLRPLSEDVRVSAVSCAEYPRTDSELFYDCLLKTHYDFIGCSESDRVGRFIAEDNLNLRKQGQLSDIACAIPRDLFRKYRYIGSYAEDLTLGIRLIRDGYQVGMLSSIRVIHSHFRAPHYYLRRSFVDVMFLTEIFSDFAAPPQNCIVGSLLGYTTLQRKLRPIKASDFLPTAVALKNFIADVEKIAIPHDLDTLDTSVELRHPRIEAWLRKAGQLAKELHYKIDETSAKSIKQTKTMFIDRISALLPFVSSTYPILDETVALEINNAIQKTLVMTAGAQLAFCYLQPYDQTGDCHFMSFRDELKLIMMAGI